MADIITSTNTKMMDTLKGFVNFSGSNALSWIVGGLGAILIIGAIVYFLWIFPKRKVYKKKITAFEIIGIEFTPTIRDTAKVVKVGKGGFEILYFKKLKIYRLSYGGRVGKDTYYFFIMEDGYWYNAVLSSNLQMIDKLGGLIPVVTTNPNMRGAYASLEEQIDSLHADKKNFMDKYGQWVFAISFVLIAGVMLWLMFREFSQAMASLTGYNQQMQDILEKVANLMANIQSGQGANNGGLVPVA